MRSVTIVGAGPAGLTAARVLAEAGLTDVLVLEREPAAGGLPRFCDHPGWGMLDLHRLYSGPRYARELTARATGAEIRTGVTVLALEGTRLRLSTQQGPETLESRVVLLATGIRETPRGPRLISGTRPWGVTTTGAFQALAQAGLPPFRQPVIIGSELVAFSAILTARAAGIRPAALIEAAPRIVARRPGGLIARHVLRVPVLTGTRLLRVEGADRVEGVVVEHHGQQRRIVCDGVVFTGRFIPEAYVAGRAGLTIDAGTGGPAIDNFFRCSTPEIFAAGNVLRPVEHSGVAAGEGAAAARAILQALRGELPEAGGVTVSVGGAMRYVVPQRIVPAPGVVRLQGRARAAHRGWLRVSADGETLSARRVKVLPERRLSLAVAAADLTGRGSVTVALE